MRDCHSSDQLPGSLNTMATNMASAFVMLTFIFYIVNIVVCIFPGPPVQPAQPNQPAPIIPTGPPHPRPRRHHRADLSMTPVSTLLAAAFGIVILYATWPQPIEAAGLLAMLLAQTSALGGQDHDPEHFWKDLFEKVPDVLAVVVAAYLLYDGRNRAIELSCKEFKYRHDPVRQVVLVAVLTGACAVLGVVQQGLVAWVDWRVRSQRVGVDEGRERKHLVLKWCSFGFLLCQLGTVSASIYYGATTIPGGWVAFNVTKIATIVTLGVGIFYSFLLLVLRLRMLPVE